MVKIRLARFGSKKRPYYHIVAADGRFKRDGRFLEQVGTYNPALPMAEARIDHSRIDHWLSQGAHVTESVSKVLRVHKKALAAHASQQ